MERHQRIVLIVDDAPEDRETYRRYLLREHRCQYEFIEAELGEEGLELCQAAKPDLILLDFWLPDLDGVEFLQQLQGNFGKSMPPVLLLTGQGNEEIAVQALKNGASDYLIKGSMTAEVLRRTVYGVIEQILLQQQLEAQNQQQQLISTIALRIHRYLDLQAVLDSTVSEVQAFLQADRVLIMQFMPDMSGIVRAEAVLPEFSRSIDRNIIDTCFQTEGGDRYLDGHYWAVDDIDQAELNECHRQMLKQFEVKANLVVPLLLYDGAVSQQDIQLETRHRAGVQLWGLLVVHQCRASRHWHPENLKLLEQLAVQIGIAIQQAELYQKLQDDLSQRKRIEAALRESEARFRTSVENMLDCFGIYRSVRDQSGQIIDFTIDYVNVAVCETNQLMKEQQIGKKLCELMPSYREAGLFEAFCQVVETGEPFEQEVSIVSELAIFDVRASCLEDGLVVCWRDITARKQAEMQLRESEERLQLSFEGSGDGLWDWNIVTGDVYLSPKWLEMLGYGPDELPHRYEVWKQLTYPDDHVWVMQVLEAHLRDQSVRYGFDYRMKTKSGEWKWISNYGKVVAYDDRGYPNRMIGVHRDINDRKIAEAALRESETRFRKLFHDSPIGIVVIGSNLQFIDVNQALCELLGYSREELLQMNFRDFTHPEDMTADYPLVWQVFRGEIPSYTLEKRYITKSNSTIWVTFTATIVRDAAGEILYGLGMVNDISARKQIETERDTLLKQAQTAQAEAEAANQAKDEFVARVSHDLRSPLNAILGWTHILRRSKSDPDRVEQALTIIERNAKAQNKLIEDLLDISRIVQGNLKLDRKLVALNQVLKEAIEAVYPAAMAQSIELVAELGPNVSYISADAARLQQIFGNLLSNALKFTCPEGRITVISEIISDKVQVTISDTGQGITADFLPYIFERFQQGSNQPSRDGLGLGLAIVKQLVEMHDGTISAHSPGLEQGSTFVIRLPCPSA